MPKCIICGSIQDISQFRLWHSKLRNKSYLKSTCLSCEKTIQRERRNRYLRGIKERLGYSFGTMKRMRSPSYYFQWMACNTRARAKRTKLKCTIQWKDILELWNKQNGICAITGLPMTLEVGKGLTGTNVSVDRIDSSKGYIKGNMQLVQHTANTMKSDLSMNELLDYCERILKTNSRN